MKFPSNSTLGQIAGFGGILIGAACYGMYFKMQENLRKAPYYKEALENVKRHPQLRQLLGDPIYFGNVDLGDRSKNFNTGHEAHFEVPIKGANKSGALHIQAKNENEDITKPKWIITTLQISLKDNKLERIVVPIKNNNEK